MLSLALQANWSAGSVMSLGQNFVCSGLLCCLHREIFTVYLSFVILFYCYFSQLLTSLDLIFCFIRGLIFVFLGSVSALSSLCTCFPLAYCLNMSL